MNARGDVVGLHARLHEECGDDQGDEGPYELQNLANCLALTFQILQHNLSTDHRQHVLDVATLVLRAVVDHVLCETADGQRLLHIHLAIILAVPGVLRILVLTKIDSHDGIVY